MTKQEMIINLKNYYETTGNIPSCDNFPASTSYRRTFGSWNNALIAANIPIKKLHNQRIEHECANCGTLTKNNRFCTVKCSAATTNAEKPKRKRKIVMCSICKTEICKPKRTTCDICDNRFANLTLKELKSSSVNGGNQYTYIRQNARIVSKQKILDGCAVCGYSKHVEIHHIKSISSFPENATVSEINSDDNLIALCRNCHWEKANGSQDGTRTHNR